MFCCSHKDMVSADMLWPPAMRDLTAKDTHLALCSPPCFAQVTEQSKWIRSLESFFHVGQLPVSWPSSHTTSHGAGHLTSPSTKGVPRGEPSTWPELSLSCQPLAKGALSGLFATDSNQNNPMATEAAACWVQPCCKPLDSSPCFSLHLCQGYLSTRQLCALFVYLVCYLIPWSLNLPPQGLACSLFPWEFNLLLFLFFSSNMLILQIRCFETLCNSTLDNLSLLSHFCCS